MRTKVLGAVAITTALMTACAPIPGEGGGGADPGKATIAQVQPTLGYVTLDAAKAYDTFAKEKVKAEYVQVSGGDAAALAALESGNVNFAAVGAEAPLVAMAKSGGEYQIVYSLMSQMSLELTVSKKFLAKAGVSPTSPLEQRLKALKGARFGVSALGGAQDKAARWLVRRAGLDPEKDVEILNGGPPSALQAGLQNDRFDAFMLTTPNGTMAERDGSGQVLIRPGTEIPELKGYYHLVLVARKDFTAKNPGMVKSVIRALTAADDMILDQPDEVGAKLGRTNYRKIPADVLPASIKSLSAGLEPRGELTADGMRTVVEFTAATGQPIVGEKLDAAKGEGDWWTNEFAGEAAPASP